MSELANLNVDGSLDSESSFPDLSLSADADGPVLCFSYHKNGYSVSRGHSG
jgi:hypothetical protein